jgi:hypothetical protein
MRRFYIDKEKISKMQNIQTQINFSKKQQQQACFIADVNYNEFLLIIQVALDLAFEAGKWEGQVELEEHYDSEQYSQSVIEMLYSKKNTTPISGASNGNTVTINLRSKKWRDGVRKSAKEYLEKAMTLVTAYEKNTHK